MGQEQGQLSGPDFGKGVSLAEIGLQDGQMCVGQAGGEAVLLARRGDEVFAISATCTHYSGPLGDGILVDDTVRCPWHHACFSLRTGEALRAPALNPVACWRVEQRDGKVFVTGKADPAAKRPAPAGAPHPQKIVILGAGAAGNAAAEMLRREGYAGRITLIGADESVPYDRPNLSKDYLAGNAPEEWIPLRPKEFYQEQDIDLLLGRVATRLDTAGKRVLLSDGTSHDYDALLICTGVQPAKLEVPGADLPHVHYLRTLADSRAIIQAATVGDTPRRAVVIGAGFIGLEVAASLRARKLEVHVVGPEARPLEHVMGPQIGAFLRQLHEEHGVIFHLEQQVASIDAHGVHLKGGQQVPADLVIVGVGARPASALIQAAGLATAGDGGVLVDEHLRTSAAGIFAAGDIARWPAPGHAPGHSTVHAGQADRSGPRTRSEHWVVAQRQGQTAARNILGKNERLDTVPFFWSQHYDVAISYVGYAERWERIDLSGSLDKRDATATFLSGGRTLAVATIGRDRDSLRAELAMERLYRDA